MELETSKEQAYDMQLSAKKPKIKIGTMVITVTVLLFVVIKGGNAWYRKWWAWVACGITVIAVVAISLLGTTSMAPTNDMGRMEMQMGEGM